jgi:hypothetical protein
MLQRLDPALERSYLALQVFQPSLKLLALGLLIGQESFDSTQSFEDCLVLLLQTFRRRYRWSK